jgi:uncharacterized protein YjbJ (UPF0337 family)
MKQLTERIKEVAGTLTGNKRLEREGRVDRRAGAAMARLDRTTDKVEHAIDKTIETGRRARRRLWRGRPGRAHRSGGSGRSGGGSRRHAAQLPQHRR